MFGSSPFEIIEVKRGCIVNAFNIIIHDIGLGILASLEIIIYMNTHSCLIKLKKLNWETT